jgi:hypothetical protein
MLQIRLANKCNNFATGLWVYLQIVQLTFIRSSPANAVDKNRSCIRFTKTIPFHKDAKPRKHTIRFYAQMSQLAIKP